MSDSVRPHRRQPTRFPRPWDSPGKNTGGGYHFLLQCMKVKSESEVTQSCPTLSDPMDCSPPGSSVYGIFQARVLEWGATAFSTSTSLELIQMTEEYSIIYVCVCVCVYIYIYIYIYTPHHFYPFICKWTSRLLPCPGYCKQCCSEHQGMCVF